MPEVFHDLLVEEQATGTAPSDADARPLKKRKTAQHHDATNAIHSSEPVPMRHRQVEAPSEASLQARSTNPPRDSAPSLVHTLPQYPVARDRSHVRDTGKARQTVIDSDESDESDMDWEDALVEDNDSENQVLGEAEPEIGDISITFGGGNDRDEGNKRLVRRRTITSVEKRRRLDIHKMHILCLLYHIHRRNAWCNDEKVHAILRRIPSPSILSNLVPNPDFSQYQASKRFMDGMNELKLLWSKRFTVTAQGMYKPRWADADAEVRPSSDFDEQDDPMDLDDFRRAASKLEGSQDVGAQLFCALLRGIGIDARLVCSLQCLPFASAAQPSTPQKSGNDKTTIVLDPYNTRRASPSRPRTTGASRLKRPSRLEQAIGERHSLLSSGVAPRQKKKYHTPYPVYWVEAFNAVHQRWVPIDALSTFTVNAPEKLEPPLSFVQNSLLYAIAFDDDYTAKDVTRRYAKAYNAKTRKFRVDSTSSGASWWKTTMRFFARPTKLDRDQVEDSALARKEASEGIPKNVQDFKDHPIYVLERHLRHNEVIYPLNQVGKVNVGSSMNPKMEPIYRRRDVHVVRSADKWYRLGRDVRDGEQPLKHAKPKKNRRMSIGLDMDLDEQRDEVGVGLYAEFQTELYVPPPVMRGRVPRNAYGNLDLYVSSMCPAGGVHIRHKLASKAARIVGVDYAEAVTGFTFKGRHGTAVVQGCVVAQEYAEAVEAVIDSMEYAQEEAHNSQRRSEALRLWRRFYLGLRIAQRVNAIEIDGERGPVISVQEEIEKEDRELTEREFAGGFFLEGDSTEPTEPGYEPPVTNLGYGKGFVPDEDEGGGGFIPENAEARQGILHEESQGFGSSILEQQLLHPQRRTSLGAGSMLDESEGGGGGFIPEESLPDPSLSGQNGSLAQYHILEDTGETNDMDSGREGKSTTDPQRGFGREGFDITEPKIIPPEVTDRPTSPQYQLQAGERTSADEPKEAASAVSQPRRGETARDAGSEGTERTERSLPPSSSPSDPGSLPLEDPEDEDAEPDWLIDAT